MKGKNKIRKASSDPHHIQVREIFYTLQGEGPFAGKRSVFIRLTGCNLQCPFCDTIWDDDDDYYMPIKHIIEMVAEIIDDAPTVELIVLTGGEPLRQDLSLLLPALDTEFQEQSIQIETNGTIYQEDALLYADVVISPKTPKIAPDWEKRITHCHLKYVVDHCEEADPNDGLPVDAYRPEMFLSMTRSDRVYVQPMDFDNDPVRTRLNHALVGSLCAEYRYRPSIQLHKLMNLR